MEKETRFAFLRRTVSALANAAVILVFLFTGFILLLALAFFAGGFVPGARAFANQLFCGFGLLLWFSLIAFVFFAARRFLSTCEKFYIEYSLALQKSKKKVTEIQQSFELVPGEKILIPSTPCFIKSNILISQHYYCRDVIVTNKRILIGSSIHLQFFEFWKSFDQVRLWHPRLKPASPPSSVLWGNLAIKSITYHHRREGKRKLEWVAIESSYFLANLFEIYHPKARRIYEIFSSPT